MLITTGKRITAPSNRVFGIINNSPDNACKKPTTLKKPDLQNAIITF